MKNLYSLIIIYLIIYSSLQAELNDENLNKLQAFYNTQNQLFSKALLGGVVNAPLYIYSLKDGREVLLGVFKSEIKDLTFAINRFTFLERMKNDGFCHLPRIIKNNNNEYLTEIDGVHYSCVEYLLEDPKDEKKPITLSCLLKVISQFHKYSKNLTGLECLSSNKLEDYKQRTPIFSNPLIHQVDKHLFNTSTWKIITTLSQYFAESEFETLYNRFPMQLVHGDCHYANIVISNQIPYIIDYDTMHYGKRILDVACVISVGYFDEYLELLKNKTFFSFIECNYEQDGVFLENIEKTYLNEIIIYRHIEVISWLITMLVNGLDNQDSEHFKLLYKFFMEYVTQLDSLFALAKEDGFEWLDKFIN